MKRVGNAARASQRLHQGLPEHSEDEQRKRFRFKSKAEPLKGRLLNFLDAKLKVIEAQRAAKTVREGSNNKNVGRILNVQDVQNAQEPEFNYSTSAWLNELSFNQLRREVQRLGRAQFRDGKHEDDDSSTGTLSGADRGRRFMKRMTIVVDQLIDGKLGINLRSNISAELIGSPQLESLPMFPSCDDEAAGVVVIGFSTPAAREFGWQLFDEIVAVNGEPVPDRDAFAQAYAKARESLPIHFAVLRRFAERKVRESETNLELAQAKMQGMLSDDFEVGPDSDPDRIADPFDDNGSESDELDEPIKPNLIKPPVGKAGSRHRKKQLEATAEMTDTLLQQNIALTEELIKCRGHLADFEYWLMSRRRTRHRRQSELPLPGEEFEPWDPQGDADDATESTSKIQMQEVLKEARTMFNILDDDRSGTVDRVELIKGLVNSDFIRAFFGLPEKFQEGYVEVKKRINNMFPIIDKDNSKSLSWKELKQFIQDHPENIERIKEASARRVARLSGQWPDEEFVRLSSQETPQGSPNPWLLNSPNVQGGWRSDHMIAIPAQVVQEEIPEESDRITELFEALDIDNNTRLTINEMAKVASFMDYDPESNFETEFEDLCKMHGCDVGDGLDLQSFRSVINDTDGILYCDDEALDDVLSKAIRANRIQKLFRVCNASGGGNLPQVEMFLFAHELGWTKRFPIARFGSEYQCICDEAGADPEIGIDEETFTTLVDNDTSDFYCNDNVLCRLLSKFTKERDGYREMDTIAEAKDEATGKVADSKGSTSQVPSNGVDGKERRGSTTIPMGRASSDKIGAASASLMERGSARMDRARTDCGALSNVFGIRQDRSDAFESQGQQNPDADDLGSSRTPAGASAALKRITRLQTNAMALKAGEMSPMVSLSSPRGPQSDMSELSSPRPEQPAIVGSPSTTTPRSSYSPMSIGRRSPELDPGSFTSAIGQRPGTIREGVDEEDPESNSNGGQDDGTFLQEEMPFRVQRTPIEGQNSEQMQTTSLTTRTVSAKSSRQEKASAERNNGAWKHKLKAQTRMSRFAKAAAKAPVPATDPSESEQGFQASQSETVQKGKFARQTLRAAVAAASMGRGAISATGRMQRPPTSTPGHSSAPPAKTRSNAAQDAGSPQVQFQPQGPPLQVEPLASIAEGAKDLGVFTFDGPGQDQKSISPQVALRQPLGEERHPDLDNLIG